MIWEMGGGQAGRQVGVPLHAHRLVGIIQRGTVFGEGRLVGCRLVALSCTLTVVSRAQVEVVNAGAAAWLAPGHSELQPAAAAAAAIGGAAALSRRATLDVPRVLPCLKGGRGGGGGSRRESYRSKQ